MLYTRAILIAIIILNILSLPCICHSDDLFEELKYMVKQVKKEGMTDKTSSCNKRNFKTMKKWKNGGLKSLIKDAAEKEGIPPSLLELIVKIESGGDRWAVSRKGAVGLCQLMPETWNALGIKDPYDPRENLRGGAKLLRMLLDKYDGNVLKAVAAYNAGEGVLKKPWDKFPKETKRYLEKVVRGYGRSS